MTLLSIVLPVYNEAENLPILQSRLIKACKAITSNFEIIYVNDGSKDNSLEIIKQLANLSENVFYVNLSRNFGHQIAISAGLDIANGQAIVIMDADLQDPPELINELYSKYKEGFDVVYAQRMRRKGDPILKKIAAKFFYKILSNITSFNMPIDTGDFRLIDVKILDLLKKMPERQKYLRGQIAWLGFKQTAVLFERDKRLHGQSNYTYGSLIRLAWYGITGFSNVPLSVIIKIGLFLTLFSFSLILFALYGYFFSSSTIHVMPSVLLATMFLGGIQLLVTGIIAEYVSNINENVKNRPLYIVAETNK